MVVCLREKKGVLLNIFNFRLTRCFHRVGTSIIGQRADLPTGQNLACGKTCYIFLFPSSVT
jgi:hypothetical protein